jgi:capsular polysaccharide biosynthesis protein
MGDARAHTSKVVERVDVAARMQRDLGAALRGSRPGKVLMAVDESPVLDPERLRRDHPEATVEVLDVRSGRRPAGRGFDAVVDATRRPDLRDALFDATFRRLAPGGTFLVLDHRPPGSVESGPAAEEQLWPRLVGTRASRRKVRRVVLDEQHLCVERSEGSRPGARTEGPELPDVVRRLVDVDRPTIAVVGSGRAARSADQLRRALPQAQVVLVGTTKPWPRRHARFAAYGPFDLMVDATADGALSAQLLRWGFLHVRGGGSMLVLDGSPLGRGPADSTPFWHALMGVVSRRGVPQVIERSPEFEWSRLATAVGRVDVGPRHVVLTNRVPALAVLRDRQLFRVARLRDDPAIQIRKRHPALLFTSRASLGESTARDPVRMPETYQVPALFVRECRDVVCIPKQLVIKGNLVLPDSFRHPAYVWQTNRSLKPMGRHFGAGVPTPERRLEGAYFHLDGELRHHYGHATTEHVSRLWAWPAAKAAEPGLRALVSMGLDRTALPEWQTALYEAAGVPREDIVTFSRPVVVERLVGATPMFSMPSFVHPGITEVWDRIGAALESRAEVGSPPERIFVTRAPGSGRWCYETPELERILGEHGYAVIRPEKLRLPDQIRVFRQAKAVAGFAGSGMFNLMFAPEPKQVLLIRSTGYTATNEYLIASVRGHHLETIACRPDVDPPPERLRAWPADGINRSPILRSSFHFDLDGDRRRLEEILRAFR